METGKQARSMGIYRIRLRGRLSEQWKDWFEGMRILPDKDMTSLEGPFVDQSALHGCLNRIRDLNLELVSVERLADE